MKNRKFIIIVQSVILIALFLITPVAAAPGDNIALNAAVESCSYVNDDEMDIFLVDEDPGYNTKWCAVDGANHTADDPYHWIILDFGAEKTFNRVSLVKASEGNRDFGQTQYDASAFYFEVSSDKINWRKVIDVTGNENLPIYEGIFSPSTARYLRLVVTAPEADPDNHTAAVRLYDLKVFEAAAPTEQFMSAEIEESTVISEILPVPLTVTAPLIAPPTGAVISLAVIGAIAATATFTAIHSRKRKRK